jgi:protein-tyrosine phosphatase
MRSAISLYTDATLVLPNIYLGNIYNARNYYKLVDINIGLVVNCTEEISDYFPDSFRYIRAPIRDSSGSSISLYIDNIVDMVYNFLKENPNKSVLFHCYMGSSRSASFLLAYMVKYMDIDLESATKFIKELRPIVNINSSFYRELKEI